MTITLFKTMGYNFYGEIRDIYWRIKKVGAYTEDPSKIEVDIWGHLTPKIAVLDNAPTTKVLKEVIILDNSTNLIKTDDYTKEVEEAISNISEHSPIFGAVTIEVDENGNEV
jgi:hypothetical protein